MEHYPLPRTEIFLFAHAVQQENFAHRVLVSCIITFLFAQRVL